MNRTKRQTTSATEILHRRYYAGRPRRLNQLAAARAEDNIARKIAVLRQKSRLTQRELAEMIGTTASVICRLEDADYEGHSLSMLQRIAEALDRRVEIRFAKVRYAHT